MTTTIVRVFETRKQAMSAVAELKRNGFGDDMVKLVGAAEGAEAEAAAVTSKGSIATALVQAGLKKDAARLYAERAGQKGAIVVARPPFGTGAEVSGILSRFNPVDMPVAAVSVVAKEKSPRAAPFSSMMGWDVLSDEATPLSTSMGIKVLTEDQKSTTKLSSEAAPFSRAFGMRTISENAAPLSSAFGWNLLSSVVAPLSSRAGWPLLSSDPTPVSSGLSLKILSKHPAPFSACIGMPVLWGDRSR